MKNLHRRVKLEDSEENGVTNCTILPWPRLALDLLSLKNEYNIYFVCAGL